MVKEIRLFSEVRSYSIITLGVFLNALAWMGFMDKDLMLSRLNR